MARLNPPSSSAVVDVPDALVDQYVAQGWVEAKGAGRVKADEKSPEPVRRRPRGNNK